MSDGCTTAPRGVRPAGWSWLRGAAGRAAIAALLAAPATQATAAPSEPTPDAHTVSELVVTATKTVSELVVTAPLKCKTFERDAPAGTPHIVGTFPAKGQVVRPGLVVVRITFDTPMACAGGLMDDPPLMNPCPGEVQRMLLSVDRRTVRTVCRLDPDKRYSVWLSRTPQNGFLSLRGLQVAPYRLGFGTSLEPAVTTICDALAEDPESVHEIEQRRKLDCAGQPDPTAARVAAEVLRQDAQARQAIELARAEAETQRARLDAQQIQEAMKLARAAYAKALRQKRADLDRATRQARRTAFERSDAGMATPDLTPPSRTGGLYDPRASGAPATRAVDKPVDWGPQPTPEAALAGWSVRVTVDGRAFLCGAAGDIVTCQRAADAAN